MIGLSEGKWLKKPVPVKKVKDVFMRSLFKYKQCHISTILCIKKNQFHTARQNGIE